MFGNAAYVQPLGCHIKKSYCIYKHNFSHLCLILTKSDAQIRFIYSWQINFHQVYASYIIETLQKIIFHHKYAPILAPSLGTWDGKVYHGLLHKKKNY